MSLDRSQCKGFKYAARVLLSINLPRCNITCSDRQVKVENVINTILMLKASTRQSINRSPKSRTARSFINSSSSSLTITSLRLAATRKHQKKHQKTETKAKEVTISLTAKFNTSSSIKCLMLATWNRRGF